MNDIKSNKARLLVVLLATSILSPLSAVAQTVAATSPAQVDPDAAVSPTLTPATVAEAKPVAPPKAFYGSVGVAKGSGRLIKLPHAVSNIFVADPTIAEVRPASQNSIFVFGKGVGNTTIETTDTSGHVVAQYGVSVAPSTYAADRLRSESQATAPGGNVTAEAEPGGVVVKGSVETPAEAEAVINQAKQISPGSVVNDLLVKQPVQVELEVRIASMQRSVTRQLGIDWGSVSATGFSIGKFGLFGNTNTGSPSLSGTTPAQLGVNFPGGTLQGVIDALASDNLAHVLAEPTLTTMSGTQANFIVGGSFPIPVSESNGQSSISFKNYGVQLTFTPTVFSNGQISLQVSPQVSSISNANSVTLGNVGGSTNSIVVPSLVTSGTSSTVMLGSGQGMAIAGLLEDSSNQTDNGIPGISEVPFLGALFRGDSFTRSQQELVITVTPYLVTPTSNVGLLPSPDDGWTPPNDFQRVLLLRDNGTTKIQGTIPGNAGFMVQ